MRSRGYSEMFAGSIVSTLALVLVLVAAGKAKPEAGLAALTVREAPKKSSPHDKLAVWAGHWKVRIETKETQLGHASTEYFDSRCCLKLQDGVEGWPKLAKYTFSLPLTSTWLGSKYRLITASIGLS